MKGYTTAIENETTVNTDFRRVLYTSKQSQLVLMSLRPGEDIGLETHALCDQFFRIEKGKGKCVIDGVETNVSGGDAIVVPVGAAHNIVNLSKTEDLKLYTIYSPPNHKDAVVKATKLDAQNQPEKFDGVTTEKFSNKPSESERIFDTRIGKIEVKVFEKIHLPKLNRREKKMLKMNKKIAKHQENIEELNEKMSKLNQAQY
ncbi:hypothetical protein BH10ACI1_BH10ACI1_25950 [soil metagenome]